MEFTYLSKYISNLGSALYTYFLNNIPGFLILEPGKNWWQTALIIILYVVLYEIIAYGILVLLMSILKNFSALMRKHDCNLFCWWQHLIYISAITMILTNSDNAGGYDKFNLFPLALFSFVFIYFIIKTQWRFIYFPFMQLYLWIFIGLTVSILLPALVLFTLLKSMAKKTTTTKKTCRYCGKPIENGKKCNCGVWVM